MFEFKMPSMGADMTSATLVAWNVKPGDTVKKGDIICEIETAKGDIDVEIWEAGIVTELLVEPGSRVPVGEAIAIIDGAAPEFVRSEVTVELPHKKIAKELGIAPRESKRPTIVKRAAGTSKTGTASSPAARARAAELGVDITSVTGSGPGGAVKIADLEGATPPPGHHRVTPVARKMAAQAGIDVNAVQATGSHDTVVKADIERTIAEAAPSADAKVDRYTALRDAIAAAMSKSKREIPHYYLKATVDVTATMAWLKAENEKRGIKDRLVFGALAARAVARAATEIPTMNGFYDGGFRASKAVHVGFAVSMRGGGVVAPAIHNVDTKTLDETMAAVKDVVRRVRGGKLRSSEMTDPTITLTSLGELGVDTVFGVIYPPQVAIVGIGSPHEAAVAHDGMVGVRTIVNVTLSGDHRVSDGMAGALFLKALENYLIAPESLL